MIRCPYCGRYLIMLPGPPSNTIRCHAYFAGHPRPDFMQAMRENYGPASATGLVYAANPLLALLPKG